MKKVLLSLVLVALMGTTIVADCFNVDAGPCKHRVCFYWFGQESWQVCDFPLAGHYEKYCVTSYTFYGSSYCMESRW